MIGDHGGVDGVGDDEVVVFAEAVDDEVVQDTTGGVGEHGVTGATHLDLGKMPDQGVVECGRGLRPGDADLTHVGEIEDPGGLTNGHVFGFLAAVTQRHQPSGEVDKYGPGGFVNPVQRGGARGRGL